MGGARGFAAVSRESRATRLHTWSPGLRAGRPYPGPGDGSLTFGKRCHPIWAMIYAHMKLLIALALLALAATTIAQSEPKAQEAKGIDLGGPTMTVFVARDTAAWDSVKQTVGKQQMIPRGMPKGDGLELLDAVDFRKQMIVAVFWGEMNFSGQSERCWIEQVSEAKGEVVVDCRATLWGGAVKASYRAWPYHVKVVPRSDGPVQFKQTTEWKAAPGRSEKDKVLATLKTGEWKQEIAVGK